MTMTIDVSHIDTSLACYLTDHHNRDGELLIGVPVDGSTTNAEVMESVTEAFASADWPDDAENVTDDDVEAAVKAVFENAKPDAPFDSSLEVNESDEDWSEPVQAWFLLTYSSDDDGSED